MPFMTWLTSAPAASQMLAIALMNEILAARNALEAYLITSAEGRCPTGATKFGERSELLAEAHQRLRENPGKYVDHIYGEHEVGGTSVLLLSSVAFEEFGYRTDFPTDPLPSRTFAVQSNIPNFVPLWGSLLGGIWWITHRREEVEKAEGKNPKGGAK